MDNRKTNEIKLIRKEDAILVMIDIQDKLFKVMSEKDRLLENAVKLAKFSRIMGLPVIVTEQQNLGDTLAVIGQELPEWSPVSKWCFSCFREEVFCQSLNRLKRKTLVLAGIEAHICVTQTALEALPGYTVHVVGDAVSSRDPRNCEAALLRMAREGVTVTTTEMVIYELLERAGTDAFREVLKLIK